MGIKLQKIEKEVLELSTEEDYIDDIKMRKITLENGRKISLRKSITIKNLGEYNSAFTSQDLI